MRIIYRNGCKEVYLYEDEKVGSRFECSPCNVESIYEQVGALEGLPHQSFFLTFNGRCLDRDVAVPSSCSVRLHLRMPGGKGGFGSMLRAIGARIEKTTNREACRDLSGRRMRDVNYEKEMGEWLKQKEKEAEDKEEREKNKLKKLDRIINPKHNYEDDGYTMNLQTNAEKIDDALKAALQKRDKNLKRKSKGGEVGNGGKEKKACGWMGVDLEDEDDEEEEGEIYSDIEEDNIVSAVRDDQPGCSKSSPAVAEDVSQESTDCHTICTKTTDTVSSSDSSTDRLYSDPGERNEPLNGQAPPVTALDNVETRCENISCDAPNMLSSVSESLSKKSPTGAVNFNDNVPVKPLEVVNLADFSSADELERVGMEVLKFSLTELGLKCGGTLQERAQRLFSTKDVPRDKLDPALFAKPSKGKNKKQKK